MNIMKKFLRFLVPAALLAGSVASCMPEEFIVVGETDDIQIVMGAMDSQPHKLSIGTNDAWTIERYSASDNWLHICDASGQEIVSGKGLSEIFLTADKNTGSSTRYASFSIETRNLSRSVSVLQEGFSFEVSVDNDAPFAAVANASDVRTISVKCSGEWIATSESDWLLISKSRGSGDGTVTVSATGNNFSATPQTAEVVITSTLSGLSKKLTFTRSNIELSATIVSGSLEFEAEDPTPLVIDFKVYSSFSLEMKNYNPGEWLGYTQQKIADKHFRYAFIPTNNTTRQARKMEVSFINKDPYVVLGTFTFTQKAASAYTNFLGSWSVPRGTSADIWTITALEKDKSFRITGIDSYDNVVATARYDAATESLILPVQTNIGVESISYNGSSYNCNMCLYGNISYQGEIYYVTGDYDILYASLQSDGSMYLAPGTVEISNLSSTPFTLVSFAMYGEANADLVIAWTTKASLPNTATRESSPSAAPAGMRAVKLEDHAQRSVAQK